MTTKRIIKNGWEEDVHTRWRHLMCLTQKPGVCAYAKTMTNRRERREKKRWIADSLDS